jgi:hypothetical protein
MLEDVEGGRLFTPLLDKAAPDEIEERMRREARFDPDFWLIEVEDRQGRHFLDLGETPHRGDRHKL